MLRGSATLLYFNHCRCCARRRECCSGRCLPSAGEKTYMTKNCLFFFLPNLLIVEVRLWAGRWKGCGMGKRRSLCADGIRLCLCKSIRKRTLATYFFHRWEKSELLIIVSYRFLIIVLFPTEQQHPEKTICVLQVRSVVNLVLRQKFTFLK